MDRINKFIGDSRFFYIFFGERMSLQPQDYMRFTFFFIFRPAGAAAFCLQSGVYYEPLGHTLAEGSSGPLE